MAHYSISGDDHRGNGEDGFGADVSAAHPCPACGKTDWCSWFADGRRVYCRRPALSGRYGGKPGRDGGLTFRLADLPAALRAPPAAHGAAKRSKSRRNTAGADERSEHIREWSARAESYATALTPAMSAIASGDLGLPAWALENLPDIGVYYHDRRDCHKASGGDRNGWSVSFPERDADCRVIGITTREYLAPIDDKRKRRKVNMTGGWRGLTMPRYWMRGDGPLFAVEGGTDVLAMSAAGLFSIGRPSVTGGLDLLGAAIRKHVACDRPIVLVGENDRDSVTGAWPGRDDARRAAQRLADANPDHTVMFAMVPCGAKDVRAWLIARTRTRSAEAWEEFAGPELSAALLRSAEVLVPTRAHPVSVPAAEPLTGPALDALCQPFFNGVDPDCGCGRGTDCFLIRHAARPRPPAPEGEADRAGEASAEVPTEKEDTHTPPGIDTPADAGRVVGDMYVSEIQHISDDAPPAEGTPAPMYREIISRLTGAAKVTYCYRVSKRMMDCVSGPNAGALISARCRCGGLCCEACHVYYRQEFSEFAEGIADGSLGVDPRRRVPTPLPVRLYSGTPKEWKALDARLRRRAKKLGAIKHGWVKVQRVYRGDVTVLIFGGPDVPGLPAPIGRTCAANVYAVQVERIERLDQEAMRGKKFRPVTDSKPPILIRKPKASHYRLARDLAGHPVRNECDNETGARAAERAGAYEVTCGPDDRPAEQKMTVGHGGVFGDRERRLCAIEGLLDPAAEDFLTRPLPWRYAPPGWTPAAAESGTKRPPSAVPDPSPEQHVARGFAALDDEFESADPVPEVPVRPIAAVAPPPGGLVSIALADESLVGPALAAAAKWILSRLPAGPPGGARDRLYWFVNRCERSEIREMREQTAVAIQMDIFALYAEAAAVDAGAGASHEMLESPPPPVATGAPLAPAAPIAPDLLPGGELPDTLAAVVEIIRMLAPDRPDLAAELLAAGDLDRAHDALLALMTERECLPGIPAPAGPPERPSESPAPEADPSADEAGLAEPTPASPLPTDAPERVAASDSLFPDAESEPASAGAGDPPGADPVFAALASDARRLAVRVGGEWLRYVDRAIDARDATTLRRLHDTLQKRAASRPPGRGAG